MSNHESSEGSLCDVHQMTLAWHNIQVWRDKPTRSQILDNINGLANPKQVVALMGASGAGKTTLLNSLMGRNLKGLEVTGDVYVGGSQDLKIGDVSGYVQQDEMFMPTLTVNEHLMIQAGLRLAGLSKAEIKTRIEEVVDELGLRKCRHSIIGLSGIKKGISGGEAKRLMVASVLLDNPSILFLDEPTTGLDSHMAQSLMNSLKKLALGGRTVIVTLHQPSSRIFEKLDMVMFLGDGVLAYMGPPTQAVPFFDALGFVCPHDYNPADYIIDVLAIDWQNNKEEADVDRIHRVADAFEESHLTRDFFHFISTSTGYNKDPELVIINRYRASSVAAFWVLLKKFLIDNHRNPFMARAKLIQKLIMGVFFGLLYLQTRLDENGIFNMNAAMYYLVTELAFAALFGVMGYMPRDFSLVVREHYDGLYSIAPYFLARICSYVPLFIFDGVLMLTIAYWMIGLAARLTYFLTFLFIGILVEQAGAAFGMMIIAICPTFTLALTISGPILTILLLQGGMYVNVDEVSSIISWTQHLSWFKYGFEAMMINQWRGTGDFVVGNKTLTTADVLQTYSFSEDHFWRNILAMFGFIVGFYLIGYFGLYIRVHRNR